MAYLTGLTPLGCCMASRYLGNGVYETEPDVGEYHRRHRIYNDYHLWYVKVVGKAGERITVRLNWPKFDPEKVSDEYKAWDSYSARWPEFFFTLKEVLYYSTDEIHWEPVEGAEEEVREDGYTLVFSYTLPADVSYLATTLRYTIASFEDLVKTVTPSPYVKMLSLGQGWDGGDLYTFVATDPDVPTSEKRTIYLHAMQHCHEPCGAHMIDFMLRFFAEGSEEARALLRRFIFRLTPIMDMAGWRLGREVHPLRVTSMTFNMNRNWGLDLVPETRLITDYLDAAVKDGERFVFFGDIHSGTGDEDAAVTGANGIFLDLDGTPADREDRRHFIDMMHKMCDYMRPDDPELWERTEEPPKFSGFVKERYGAPAYTFEVSQSKSWDREAGIRIPHTQARHERRARQFLDVIVAYVDEREAK